VSIFNSQKKNEANEEYSNNLFYKNVYLIFMFDIQSDQQENKSRVLPHRLFYRNLLVNRTYRVIHERGRYKLLNFYFAATNNTNGSNY
jgi:hypothetical protein